MGKRSRKQKHDRVAKVSVQNVKELTEPITSVAPKSIPPDTGIMNWRRDPYFYDLLKFVYKF